MTKHSAVLVTIVCTAAILSVSATAQEGSATEGRWALEELKTVEGLKIPECLLVDKANDVVYVSNVDTDNEGYWVDDSKGFLSTLTPEGDVKKLRWLDSTAEAPIHSPKGMTLLKGYLYFSDNTRLMRTKIAGPSKPEHIPLPDTQHLNDIGTDGTSVYVSDTVANVIYKVNPKTKAHTLVKAPESINGVTFDKGKMFGVSWDLHEVYELDATGKKEPKPFGLAEHFTNLDAIEFLDDGTIIVSDFVGNKVSAITPDRKTVYTLAELQSPADIGLDKKRGLLYVPLLLANKAVVYKLKKNVQ